MATSKKKGVAKAAPKRNGAAKKAATKPVMVTTEHRGVFFGYVAPGEDLDAAIERKTLRIERARNCLYWHASVKGFLGLAEGGPNGQCRIGPPTGELYLSGVTAIVPTTEGAAAAWERAPWS